MNDCAIRVENLGKCYTIGGRLQYKTLRDQLASGLNAPSRLVRSIFRNAKRDAQNNDAYLWAIRNVSFEIKHGEAVGIIGRNGAGKSTLLKILSRITEPTEGRGEIYGRVGSLLEVGTGFHPELTGRENIFLNAAILGMRKVEIKKKFDDIVSFAEIDKFIDTPVKHYSSGMYVRLAFAVAAHLEPEILLVDEVLAVGDAAFQKKCLGKMGDVTQEGRTVIFVSHNMGAVRAFCNRAILIDQGRLVIDGEPSSVISNYLAADDAGETEGQVFWANEEDAPGCAEMKLRSIRLLGQGGVVRTTFETDKPIKIEVTYKVNCQLQGFRLRLGIVNAQGETAFVSTDQNVRNPRIEPGVYRSICTIPANLLNVGRYIVRIGAGIPGVKKMLSFKDYVGFNTSEAGNQGSIFPEIWPGVVCPKLDWVIEKGEETSTYSERDKWS